MADNNYKKKMSLTGFVAQLVTIGLLFVFWRLGQKWVVVPAAAMLIFLFFFLPRVINKLEARFHKKALMLLATGKASEVPEYASRQVLLSLFGASAPVDAKVGLALAQIGRFEEAIECLSNALPYAPAGELPALQSAYVKALLVTGDPARAEAEGRQILKQGTVRLAEVLILTARARLGLGKTGPETNELIEEAATQSASGDIDLMLKLTQIELNLSHGRKPDELDNDADSTQPFLRAWIHLVRGQLRENRGKTKDAMASYAQAIKIGKDERCWFADMARKRLELLSASAKPNNVSPRASRAAQQDDDSNAAENTSLDDVSRRKRKRRR